MIILRQKEYSKPSEKYNVLEDWIKTKEFSEFKKIIENPELLRIKISDNFSGYYLTGNARIIGGDDGYYGLLRLGYTDRENGVISWNPKTDSYIIETQESSTPFTKNKLIELLKKNYTMKLTTNERKYTDLIIKLIKNSKLK